MGWERMLGGWGREWVVGAGPPPTLPTAESGEIPWSWWVGRAGWGSVSFPPQPNLVKFNRFLAGKGRWVEGAGWGKLRWNPNELGSVGSDGERKGGTRVLRERARDDGGEVFSVQAMDGGGGGYVCGVVFCDCVGGRGNGGERVAVVCFRAKML